MFRNYSFVLFINNLLAIFMHRVFVVELLCLRYFVYCFGCVCYCCLLVSGVFWFFANRVRRLRIADYNAQVLSAHSNAVWHSLPLSIAQLSACEWESALWLKPRSCINSYIFFDLAYNSQPFHVAYWCFTSRSNQFHHSKWK